MLLFRQNNDGFALLSVLLFLLVVTAIVTPLVLSARTDLVLASSSHNSHKQNILAEGLMSVVARQIASFGYEINDRLLLNSMPMRSKCGNQLVELRIQDQLSVIDLNGAGSELLQAGFEALNLGSVSESELSDLAISFREIDNPLNRGQSNKLTDGFKRAPFEAIEELYEFPGFSKLPVQRLGEIFTVYGRRATINAGNMSEALSKILPSAPSSKYPFILVEPELANFYRIEVSVQPVSRPTTGYSGAIIEVSDNMKGSYRTVEGTTNPLYLGAKADIFVPNYQCRELFGPGVQEWITGL